MGKYALTKDYSFVYKATECRTEGEWNGKTANYIFRCGCKYIPGLLSLIVSCLSVYQEFLSEVHKMFAF